MKERWRWSSRRFRRSLPGPRNWFWSERKKRKYHVNFDLSNIFLAPQVFGPPKMSLVPQPWLVRLAPSGTSGLFLTYQRGKSQTFQLITQVNFGEGFTARVDIENKTENIRTLETIITCTSLYYNGVPAHRIKVVFGFNFFFVLGTCFYKNSLLVVDP